MRYLFLAALLIGAVSAGVLHPPHLAPLLPLEESENVIPEEYIVIFKKTASELDVQHHLIFLNNMFEFINGTYQVQHVYDMGPDLRGYAAIMNEQMLYSVRGMQEVDYVEKNQLGDWGDTDHLKNFQWPDSDDEDESDEFDQDEVEDTDEVEEESEEEELLDQEESEEPSDDESELDDEDDDDDEEKRRKCKVQRLTKANWALSRISHKKIQSHRLRYRYKKKYQGKGVNIYIIDSGIDVTNPDFGGRAKWGINLNGGPEIDWVGHGTSVAGCAMSKTYGVAKKATAIAVGIDRNGSPDTALVIAAFQWVQKNHKKRKSIANGSFNVGSTATAAAEALVKSGVPVVIAAGNSNWDACSFHPASSKKVITVAASDRYDYFASFSNFGKCVNLIAPGVDIQTTRAYNNNPTTTNGTSFSAPYTSGVLATIMCRRRRTKPRKALRLLRRRSLRRKIKNVPKGTPNRLLNSRCR